MQKPATDGIEKELKKLLQDNYTHVFGFLLKMSGNIEIAEDITQEVMIKAILKIKQFKGNSKFSTWLISIAANTCRDSFRKKRLKTISMDYIDIPSDNNPETTVLADEKRRILNRAILNLPEKQRKIFILKQEYNYSNKEIAEICKCPVGTVKSRLFHSIESLANQVKHYIDPGVENG